MRCNGVGQFVYSATVDGGPEAPTVHTGRPRTNLSFVYVNLGRGTGSSTATVAVTVVVTVLQPSTGMLAEATSADTPSTSAHGVIQVGAALRPERSNSLKCVL